MENHETTPLTYEQLRVLHNRITPSRVAKRQNMSYLEAWDVKTTLIRVFGYGGFSAECLEAKIVREEQLPQSNSDKLNWSVSAQATVRITIPQLGAVYTESAIANNKQPDWAEAADTALKSAESDALKRAAIYLGTQFGLSLYNNGATDDVVKLVLSPGQHEIVNDINTSRSDTPEAKNALARLQGAMKVAPEAETAPEPVAAPEPVQVDEMPPLPVSKVRVTQTTSGRKPAGRKTTRKATTTESVTADRQAVARQALANAERTVGMTDGDAADPSYGPGAADYVMDDEIQAREDAR